MKRFFLPPFLIGIVYTILLVSCNFYIVFLLRSKNFASTLRAQVLPLFHRMEQIMTYPVPWYRYSFQWLDLRRIVIVLCFAHVMDVGQGLFTRREYDQRMTIVLRGHSNEVRTWLYLQCRWNGQYITLAWSVTNGKNELVGDGMKKTKGVHGVLQKENFVVESKRSKVR